MSTLVTRPDLPTAWGQQRGVVAGAGADLQDALARLQVELLQHDGHDGRLRGRAGGYPHPRVW